MAVYAIADIHGEYDLFMELLDKIALQDTDTLYVVGDVVDRGPHPVKVLQQMMLMPNVIPLAGNHELMAMECLGFLNKEITDESIASLEAEMIDNLLVWQKNGSASTLDEFSRLDEEERQDILDYLSEFQLYEQLQVNGQKYLLVHAGLGGYRPDRRLDSYSPAELLWTRADYETCYFNDMLVISGHTPTQLIEENPRPGYIYRHNNHVAIDCGACFAGGRLAAFCLDSGEEFYSSEREGEENG